MQNDIVISFAVIKARKEYQCTLLDYFTATTDVSFFTTNAGPTFGNRRSMLARAFSASMASSALYNGEDDMMKASPMLYSGEDGMTKASPTSYSGEDGTMKASPTLYGAGDDLLYGKVR